MIYQDFSELINREALKDSDFRKMIGRDRTEETFDKTENIRLCEEYRNRYSQPPIFDISNNRPFTDSLLCPSHYDWDEAQTYHSNELKAKYPYVTVTDYEIRELRLESLNNLSQGSASNRILREKLLKEVLGDAVDGVVRVPEVIDALYCARQKATLYFYNKYL